MVWQHDGCILRNDCRSLLRMVINGLDQSCRKSRFVCDQCSLREYTVKYSPGPREFLKAEPKVSPEGSGCISPYSPT